MGPIIKCTEDRIRIRVMIMDGKILSSDRIRLFETDISRIIEYAGLEQKRIILDIGRVRFMSSAMVNALVHAIKSTRALRVHFRIAQATPVIRELFRIIRLPKQYLIDGDDDDDPGEAGVPAGLTRPPKNDGGLAT